MLVHYLDHWDSFVADLSAFMYTFHASLAGLENEMIMHSVVVYYSETCDVEISRDHNDKEKKSVKNLICSLL